MVVEVIINLIYFIILFFLFIIMFSIQTRFVMINDSLGSIFNEDDGGSARLPGFLHIILNNYLLSMGSGSNDETGNGLSLLVII